MGISMLLAMLLSLTELSYRNEMVAIWAAGVSPVRFIGFLMPLAILAGGLQFLLNDTAIPATTPQLRDWGIGDYGRDKLRVGEKDPIWMRARHRHPARRIGQHRFDRAEGRHRLPP